MMIESNEADKKIETTESTEDESPVAFTEEMPSEINDDEIIDLVETVETEDDDVIIDLVETVETEDDNLIAEAVDFDDKFDTETMVPGVLTDDFTDSLGVEIDSGEDISKNIHEAEKVSDEQVEAALERVIRNLFYEKIDRLLVETIEKTVTREIEKLKKALLEDQA